MSFKPQTVLRLKQSLRTGSSPRTTFPAGTRVVVVSVKDGLVTVRPQAKAGEKAVATRIAAKATQFEPTRRGRPMKEPA